MTVVSTLNRSVVFGSVVIASIGLFSGDGRSEQGFIAGTTPWQRPAGAPAITSYEIDGAEIEKALKGISEPYPWSLRFLDDQGNWFTPFSRPGIPGVYDIRNLHAK